MKHDNMPQHSYKISAPHFPIQQQEKSPTQVHCVVGCCIFLFVLMSVKPVTSPLPLNQERSSYWSVHIRGMWRSRPSTSLCEFTQPYRRAGQKTIWCQMHHRYDTHCTHLWAADTKIHQNTSVMWCDQSNLKFNFLCMSALKDNAVLLQHEYYIYNFGHRF